MSDNNKAIPPENYKNLRKRAEEHLQSLKVELENMPVLDVKKLVHELQVHQIELQTTVENLNETQIELTRSYERYRELYESAPVGYMTIDENGNILQANETIADILGISKGELVKKYLTSLVAETDRERIFHFLKDVKTTPLLIQTADFTFERFPYRDIIYLRVKAASAVVPEGEPREFKVTFIDITDEKRARAELQEAKLQQEQERKLLQIIMDTIPVMLCVHDPVTHEFTINNAVTAIAGWTKEDCCDSGPFELLLPDRDSREILEQLRKTHQNEWQDFLIQCKDSSRKTINLTSIYLSDKREVCIGVDVTERKRLELDLEKQASELKNANEELESFVHSVTHDLRNPLHAVSTFIQFIKEESKESLKPDSRDLIDRIDGNIARMKDIIASLLSLTQVNRQDLSCEDIDLTTLAHEIITQLKKVDPRDNVHLEIEHDITVRADRNLIRMVLENLLQNAWKYTSKKEHTSIAFGKTIIDGKEVCFIKDNGAGFDQKHASRIFTPFKRLHAEKEFTGTGIGLSIVKKIIERHCGTIWAEGRQGLGATFYFYLP
jgi:PAS domain S-box-containing protein